MGVTLRPPSRMILLLLLLFTPSQAYSAYFADFSALAQDREPTCVPIPQNMSLCSNIGYTKMRLPNLLEHDTIQEASSQATYWVPLTHAQCAEDTQLFLCSLFAPVCLERPIYPCRSLCQKVKAGCEEKMSSQGYPWPSIWTATSSPWIMICASRLKLKPNRVVNRKKMWRHHAAQNCAIKRQPSRTS